ncbi:nickel-responsive transcriptional regulator NikR [Mangrovitalea sediminis]|uniref:nickel-responsive transcriptional regulator NikR n=1 Tax=Mangrovitalea sediminis TaxID=1982043 RepID=UPI000BE5A640|nr:nickel-responsive transcriptional regulator NikR [Mangrovitalea sediminis]
MTAGLPIRPRPVSRISVSLPEDLVIDLDRMVASRGFESRSQAIAEMINQQLANHHRQLGQEVMAGTVTLFYDHSTRGLQNQLADLQHRYIDEVISSLHVHLERSQTMEVILVQGPACKLQSIADEMITLRGVITGRLQLMASVIPPLHSPNQLADTAETLD